MRILITVTEPSVGDHGQRALAYATGLQKRGHEVLLAHRESDNLARTAGTKGIPRRVIETRSGPESPDTDVLSLRWILRSFRPDVVHVDSVTAALCCAASSPPTPVLITLERLDISRRRFDLAIRTSRARVYTTSQITARSLARQGINSGVQVISPGMDLAEVAQEAQQEPTAPIPGKRPLVVCANPHPATNGGIDAIEAWQQVIAARPDALLLIVGAGLDRGPLRKRAGELGIFHEVSFVDDHPSSAPYLAAADIVVVPAREESTTLSALRAMALERPVVATAVGGMPQVVRDDDTGWLVPPDNAGALSRGLLEALASSSERARRAGQGRHLIERNHGLEEMVDRVEDECRAAAEMR